MKLKVCLFCWAFQISSLSCSRLFQRTVKITFFDQNSNFMKNSNFATPGKPLRSPKNQNQIASAYQFGYFQRVSNVASNIPRYLCIMKEPNAHLTSVQAKGPFQPVQMVFSSVQAVQNPKNPVKSLKTLRI